MTRYGVRRRSRGWIERLRRAIRYKLIIPVFRSPHPPEYTARGVAIGVLWGLTPLMGLQTAGIFATWLTIKRLTGRDSSVLQALIWAWVNNPVTMIPMYYLFYVTGLWLTGTAGSLGGYDAFVALWDRSEAEPTFIARVTLLARVVGIALVAGCVPYALAGSWLSYHWALGVLRARRRRLSDPARSAPRA
jgi:uncharacterized protein (DUF2062 family)